MNKKRLKVLIVAAAAHPERGSEPGLGWGWIEALSLHHDLWVIIGERERNREAIHRRFREIPELSDRVILFLIDRPDGPIIQRLWPPAYYTYYRRWHSKAFKLARWLHQRIRFDIVHQLNMIGYREPGYLWQLDAPFVWGPVGGTANIRLQFLPILGFRQAFYHGGRGIINRLQLRYHKRVRAALARADGFVAATSDTREAFLRVYGKDSSVIADTGPPLKPVSKVNSTKSANGRINLSWSGLHISRKALPLLLRALADVPEECKWHLDIVGEGPMTKKWQRLSNRLNINERCAWHGWLGREDAMRIVGSSDLFVFPSLQEATSSVVMEALSLGTPVICLDHCGHADIVKEDCGIKLPVTGPQRVKSCLAVEVARLAKAPEELRRLSKGALRRSQQFSWQRKASQMVKLYERAIRNYAGFSSKAID
jgi:glycosyltransferase involved in cell wall biosynthesis